MNCNNLFSEKYQWAQCDDCSKWRKLPMDALLPSKWTCSSNVWDPKRSSCLAVQELTTQQLEDLLSSNTAASKKSKAKQEIDIVDTSEGLDTLANLAILGEGESLDSLSQPTTKHPRHRPGCTCIVCIQPPSGKGPKHKPTCTCNVCLTVKRRFRTLMLRREKRQSEKEAETAKQQHAPESSEKSQVEAEELMASNKTSSPNLKPLTIEEFSGDLDPDRRISLSSLFKGQIDLNIQPEREEEPSPVSDSGRDATDMYVKSQILENPVGNGECAASQMETVVSGEGERANSGHHDRLLLDDDVEHLVPLSLPVSASTSGNG